MSCCLVRLSNGGLGPPGETALSHYLRARGVTYAVVPHWRAAWIRWLSLVTSEASAQTCFELCYPSQTQNLSNFHSTQRTGPSDASLPSRLQKTSSLHASASPLVQQLHHYSIGFPLVWRTTVSFDPGLASGAFAAARRTKVMTGLSETDAP